MYVGMQQTQRYAMVPAGHVSRHAVHTAVHAAVQYWLRQVRFDWQRCIWQWLAPSTHFFRHLAWQQLCAVVLAYMHLYTTLLLCVCNMLADQHNVCVVRVELCSSCIDWGHVVGLMLGSIWEPLVVCWLSR